MNYRGIYGSKPYSSYKANFQYDKKQMSIMATSMLTAGIGFVATFLVGILCEYLLQVAVKNNSAIAVDTLYMISGIMLVVGTILAIIWCFRMYTASTFFAVTTIVIYCLSYGIGFGFLFYALDVASIIFAFGVVGIIFLATYLISKIVTIKAALTLAKILFISSIVALIVIFASNMIIFYTNILGSYGTAIKTAQITVAITTAITGVLSVLYLVWNLWCAQNMDQFIYDGNTSKKVGLFIGFQILINLVQLVMLILRLFLIFGNRSN